MVQIEKSWCLLNREFPEFFKTHQTFIFMSSLRACRSLKPNRPLYFAAFVGSCSTCSADLLVAAAQLAVYLAASYLLLSQFTQNLPHTYTHTQTPPFIYTDYTLENRLIFCKFSLKELTVV